MPQNVMQCLCSRTTLNHDCEASVKRHVMTVSCTMLDPEALGIRAKDDKWWGLKSSTVLVLEYLQAQQLKGMAK